MEEEFFSKEAEIVSKTDYRAALQVIAQMRQAQKAYFKSRQKADLIDSKRLETAVDMQLSSLGIKAV